MNSRMRRPAAALITTALAASVVGLVPAATAAPLTSISGHISAGGAELTDDVYVTVFTLDGDETVGDEAYPDENGDYVVEGIEPGTYVVTFQSPEGTYVYEAYDDATQFEDADPVEVGSAPVTDIDADLAVAGQITGTVEDEHGEALSDASIGLYSEVSLPGGGTDWDYVDGASTDELGGYTIDRLEAGSYLVDFRADRHITEYFDDAASIEEATLVEVEPAVTTPDIDAQLADEATISGTVTGDEDQPLPGTYVFAYAGGDFDDIAGSARADEDGDYTIDGLAAEDYVVYFDYEDEDADVYLDEYYDNVGDAEQADVLELVAGDDVTEIDAQLIEGEHDPVELPSIENVAPPVISGTPQVGSPLTASAGTWLPTPTRLDYYWLANDGEELLQSGTSATYVPTAADLGKVISVYVFASAEGYDEGLSYAVSSGPVVAAPVPPAPTPTPTPTPTPSVDVPAGLAAVLSGLDVAGKPKVGSTVKVTGLDKLFRSTAVSYKFQWSAGSKKIKKATKSKLKITSAMRGKKISVKVTATAASTTRSTKLILGKAR